DARHEIISVSLGAGFGGLAFGSFLTVLTIGMFSLVRVGGQRAGGPEPPPIAVSGSYVALGGSYSAGEGVGPFGTGPAETGCNRSGQSFPRLLTSFAPGLDLGASGFVACGGAVTADIYSPRAVGHPVPPQVPPGKRFPDVRLVTITVGANDLAFKDVAARC